MTKWLVHQRPRAAARLHLFCFPYAGGGASIFRPWLDHLPLDVGVYAVQLPGRETRWGEPPLACLRRYARILTEVLRPHLGVPAAFFGHSMGALLAFEVAHGLRQQGFPFPMHLFVSGCVAPHRISTTRRVVPLYKLPNEDLIERLRRFQGTPEQVLDNADLMSLLLPVLRADLKAFETYKFEQHPPLTCPISAFGGLDDDEVFWEDLVAWREQTRAVFKFFMLPGNHFFLHTARDQVLASLSSDLDARSSQKDP